MTTKRPSKTPTRADWGNIDSRDLDAVWAREQFLGKSPEEAEELFAANALFYGEALSSMPPVPLNFYAPVLARYLTSPRAGGDADGASSFLNTLSWLLEKHPQDLEPEAKKVLISAAEHVANNQDFYEASISIYKRFPERFNRIRRLSRRPLSRT